MGLTRQQFSMVAVLLLGALLAVLNQTLLTPALPTIMEHLDVNATTVQWLTSGYSLVEAVIIPLNAFLLGRFPTRRLFVGGMALFAAGSGLCAAAPSFAWLFIGRICQASATGVLMPTVFTLIILIFPRESRGSAMGIIGLIVSFAPAVGPSISGVLVDSIGWRALFVLVTALALLIVITSALTLKNFEGFDKTSFDLVSIALLACGMVMLLYGLSTFTSTDNVFVSIALMIVGVAVLGLFAWRQTRLDEPLLRVQVLGHRQFRIATIVITLMEAVLIGSSVILPMFVQNALGQSATVSGLLMLPGAVLGAVGGLLAGRVFDRRGIRGVTLVGATILLIGVAGYFSFGAHASIVMVGVVYGIACIGLQSLVTPMNTWGINSLPNSSVPHGNAIISTMEQVGSSFGTAFVVSLTALSVIVAPDAIDAASQMYVGCHVAFAGILGLVLVIDVAILLFVRDKKKEKGEDATDTPQERWKVSGLPGVDRPWLVGDVMDATPGFLREDATIRDAIEIMQLDETSGLTIVDDEGRAVGFISDGDIIRRLSRHNATRREGDIYTLLHESETMQERLGAVRESPALELANRNVISADAGDSAESAFRALSERQIKKAPCFMRAFSLGRSVAATYYACSRRWKGQLRKSIRRVFVTTRGIILPTVAAM